MANAGRSADCNVRAESTRRMICQTAMSHDPNGLRRVAMVRTIYSEGFVEITICSSRSFLIQLLPKESIVWDEGNSFPVVRVTVRGE